MVLVSGPVLSEAGQASGLIVECGDDLDQPGDRQSISHAAGRTDEFQTAARPSQVGAVAYEHADSGAVDGRQIG